MMREEWPRDANQKCCEHNTALNSIHTGLKPQERLREGGDAVLDLPTPPTAGMLSAASTGQISSSVLNAVDGMSHWLQIL